MILRIQLVNGLCSVFARRVTEADRAELFVARGQLARTRQALYFFTTTEKCVGKIIAISKLKHLQTFLAHSKEGKQARRYDTRTTIFSPEGRLYQVEYAMEAIGHAGTCLGILAADGIILAAEKKNTNVLLDDENFFSDKIYKLNDDMVCSVAGITSDANVLTNELRLLAQRYMLQYGESMPCEQLVAYLCDIKQAYTQYGGKRPFGVSILYMGWDKHYGFQLYQSDPSGNYGGWKATCIGNNSNAAISMLKQDYKEGLSLQEAKAMVIKILSKTLDTTKLSPEKLEIATLTRVNNKTKMTSLKQEELVKLIEDHDKIEKEEEARKKKEQEAKASSSS